MTMFPLTYMGSGQFQTPRGFIKRADKDLVIGETLQWEIHHARSAESHRHYFAVIADAWANLPESISGDFPSSEHLRKWALIKTGYCSKVQIVCCNNDEAAKALHLMKGMDTYSLCELSGRVVTVWRADSQSMRAMGNKTFQQSKEKVLQVISELLGADATQAGLAA